MKYENVGHLADAINRVLDFACLVVTCIKAISSCTAHRNSYYGTGIIYLKKIKHLFSYCHGKHNGGT